MSVNANISIQSLSEIPDKPAEFLNVHIRFHNVTAHAGRHEVILRISFRMLDAAVRLPAEREEVIDVPALAERFSAVPTYAVRFSVNSIAHCPTTPFRYNKSAPFHQSLRGVCALASLSFPNI